MTVRSLAATLCILLLGVGHLTQAADGTWNVDSDGNWSDAGNWLGGIVADGVDFTANFTNDITSHRTINIGAAGRKIGNIIFEDDTRNLNIEGGELTLDVTAGRSILRSDTGNNRFFTIRSVIAGNDGITAIGEGRLNLAGNNTFTGGIEFDAASQDTKVRLGHNNAAGPGSILMQGTDGTLELHKDVVIANTLTIGNTGDDKTLTVAGSNNSAEYAGSITIQESDAGHFRIVPGANGTLTISGNINGTGAAGITKTGNGILSLTAANTYTGLTTVSAGTLAITNANAIRSGNIVHLAKDAIFDATGIGAPYNPAGITFTGNGQIRANTQLIMAGAFVSPGNSPGTWDVIDTELVGFGTYNWEVMDAQGIAGDVNGYDLINVTNPGLAAGNAGQYAIQATDMVNLMGLNGPSGLDISVAGNTTVLDILTTENGITGNVGDIGFNPGNLAQYGTFALGLDGTNRILQLTFTSTIPEPGTWAIFGLLVIGCACYSRSRKSMRSSEQG